MEPDRVAIKRIHKYLILLMNPFVWGVFFDVQNVPKNFYKSRGNPQTPVSLRKKISIFTRALVRKTKALINV